MQYVILILGLCVICIACFEIRKIRLINEEHLKVLETESLTDKLTGLGNRRAFDEKMTEIHNDPDAFSDAVLIMLDVNGLKFTNDTYGHNAGDELIESCASCIRETLGHGGHCYRIGGDEFTVVLYGFAGSLSTREEAMRKWIANYNQQVIYKMSVAYGDSKLQNPDGTYKSISDWKQDADVNMYRNKRLTNQSRSNILEEEYQDIIRCIINILETRSELNFQHSNRVKAIAAFITDSLGLSERESHQIELAAVLHDIGKICIPDDILLKPGHLNDHEFELVKQHPQEGAKIFSHANSLVMTSEIILHHHERFDGKGYPDGLSGEDIPLGSRIIALADSIDAMTTRRAYRNAYSLDECKDEIVENLGKMYDPKIGQMLIDNWDEVVKIILSHPNDFD